MALAQTTIQLVDAMTIAASLRGAMHGKRLRSVLDFIHTKSPGEKASEGGEKKKNAKTTERENS